MKRHREIIWFLTFSVFLSLSPLQAGEGGNPPQNNPIQLPTSSIDNPFWFAGARWDQETGHYHMRARQYEPKAGRFVSRDPLGYVDSPNPYSYAFSSPVNFVDPFGLESAWDRHQQDQASWASGVDVGVRTGDWGQVMHDPKPNTPWGGYVEAGGIAAASLIPGVADVLDFLIILDPRSSNATKWMALASLGAGFGPLPNPGPAGRAGAHMWKDMGWPPRVLGRGKAGKTGRVCGNAAEGVKRVGGKVANRLVEEAQKVERNWEKANSQNVVRAVLYHYKKHVVERGRKESIEQYTRDALKLFSGERYPNSTKKMLYSEGKKPRWRLTTSEGPGGIFTEDGKVVTFWYTYQKSSD